MIPIPRSRLWTAGTNTIKVHHVYKTITLTGVPASTITATDSIPLSVDAEYVEPTTPDVESVCVFTAGKHHTRHMLVSDDGKLRLVRAFYQVDPANTLLYHTEGTVIGSPTNLTSTGGTPQALLPTDMEYDNTIPAANVTSVNLLTAELGLGTLPNTTTTSPGGYVSTPGVVQLLEINLSSDVMMEGWFLTPTLNGNSNVLNILGQVNHDRLVIPLGL